MLPARVGHFIKAGHFIRQGLLAVIIVIACVAPVMAAPMQLPPIVEPASHEHHAGKIIFVELVTPDLAAAEQFYAGLFGWTFKEIEAGGKKYAEALLDGYPVAGIFQKEQPAARRLRPSWLGFFSAPDLDKTEGTALKNGAKVLFGPRDIPDRGREAILADPQGAVFAVLSSSSGDPPDVMAEPGEWIWSALITTGPETDAAFYQKLFDYEVYELSASGSAEHLLLSSGGYARASINSLPQDRPDAHPHWLNFIRVEDAVKTAAKVSALGGRVLVEPRIDRQGGKVAVVADPSGAVFGLLEWPVAGNEEAPK